MNEVTWKKKFLSDVKTKLIISKKEFDLYKSTGKVIYLQQAGNKLFSAVENYLMIKYSKKVRSYSQVLQFVKNNRDDTELLTQAVHLHYFFYNGDVYSDRYTIEEEYKIVYEKMKRRVK